MASSENGPSAGRPAGVHIGSVHGSAVSIGDHSSAHNVNNHADGSQDPVQAELLEAVRALRGDLARFLATDGTARLDAELAAAEDEIAGSGAASRSRLARLREALTLVGPVTSGLASAVAVAQSVRTLLGG